MFFKYEEYNSHYIRCLHVSYLQYIAVFYYLCTQEITLCTQES